MRFIIEMEGVIDAESEQHANALAEEIASTAKLVHGPMPTFGPISAVLATLDVAAVTPKTAVPA